MSDKYQVMPDLSPDDYNELKSDIANRGVQIAVEYDEEGNILDGHHRVRACQELGITEWARVVRVGMSEEQKKEHARNLNMARRHLNREQRQELIRQQLQETPEKSDRQIAVGLGVSPTTVGTTRKELIDSNHLSKLDTSIGSDGKEYPRQVERKPITIYEPTPSSIECAKELLQDAAPELIQAVAMGKVPLMQAYGVANHATPIQQVEAVKRVESGEAPYLMEGYNQQKSEKASGLSKEQIKTVNDNCQKHNEKINKEHSVVRNIHNAISEPLTLDTKNVIEDVRVYLEWHPSETIDEHIRDCVWAINKLQDLKKEFEKYKKIRVVK